MTPVTFITGVSKGIGKFLASHYLEQGHLVFGCSRSNSDLVHKNFVHIPGDITVESDIKNMFYIVRQKAGRLDNLINNAGIASMNHLLLTPTETAQRVINTNYLGTFLICREGARLLQKSDRGRIVNFTTVAVALDLDGEAIYASSKAAVESLTKILAKELGSFKITVNAIGPTPIETDLIKNVPSKKIDNLLNRQAIKRMGQFRDVKNVVDFYLSPESDFISGQIIYLGGVV